MMLVGSPGGYLQYHQYEAVTTSKASLDTDLATLLVQIRA